ncbi:RICIN domain-containing protein [Actinoplanes sp. TFC3]|uniref:RICIN domain-containing protein n=1 Tax=Actinoplanes sp. TFC3 TaxID=1710355 RepID=UPI000833A580|nr:RICIN domain-containing protein [Actinoplanes sp. TFC3]
MADSTDDAPPDPVLVRPYITTEPGTAAWPRSATLPPEEATASLPVVAPAPPPSESPGGPSPLRQRLLVLSGIVILALGAAGVLLLTTHDDKPSRATMPGTDFSYVPTSATITPGIAISRASAAAPASAPASRPSQRSTASRQPGASGQPAGTPSAGYAVPPPPSAAPTSVAPADPTQAPPPASALTGPITSGSDRCLALGGLLGVDGTPIITSGCSGVSYQSFTLATDGTLRVAGHCTQATGDATVRSVGCDDRASAQWRRGPGGTLVNQAGGLCLTDPGSSGATVRVSACTGAADQVWSLT